MTGTQNAIDADSFREYRTMSRMGNASLPSAPPPALSPVSKTPFAWPIAIGAAAFAYAAKTLWQQSIFLSTLFSQWHTNPQSIGMLGLEIILCIGMLAAACLLLARGYRQPLLFAAGAIVAQIIYYMHRGTFEYMFRTRFRDVTYFIDLLVALVPPAILITCLLHPRLRPHLALWRQAAVTKSTKSFGPTWPIGIAAAAIMLGAMDVLALLSTVLRLAYGLQSFPPLRLDPGRVFWMSVHFGGALFLVCGGWLLLRRRRLTVLLLYFPYRLCVVFVAPLLAPELLTGTFSFYIYGMYIELLLAGAMLISPIRRQLLEWTRSRLAGPPT